jgi:hypothetical protein
MAENITVKPTPIQRNAFDVAIELLKMHEQRAAIEVDDLEKTFARYYAIANVCERTSAKELLSLIDEELKNKIFKKSY